MKASVKWFNNEKGYGFIEYAKGDIFVHYTALQQDGYKTLDEGDVVEFFLVETEKGYQAKNVILKPSKKSKKGVTRENVELVAAIATIAGFVLTIVSSNDKSVENQININCENCQIQIIEQDDERTINIGPWDYEVMES